MLRGGLSYYRALAIIEIKAERRRQIEVEGWTPEHDDAHSTGELRLAANAYLRAAEGKVEIGQLPEHWPWEPRWWKPDTAERALIKAGALCEAEEDRLDRSSHFFSRPSALQSIGELRRRTIQRLAMLYRHDDEGVPF